MTVERWKFRKRRGCEPVDPVGPATLYGGQRGEPDLKSRPDWFVASAGERPAAAASTRHAPRVWPS